MENKVLGLDGQMHEVKPDMENIFDNTSKVENNTLQTGMIMDAIENPLTENNSATISDMDKGQPAKIDPETLQKILAYQNKKPSVREYAKIGRNDPCPCGSGLKYKNCCLNSGKYEKLVKMKKGSK